ncbi:MAG: hypothetical protein AAGI45_20830 [Cyanobacteria bacterium P01_H01_bin.26]
MMASDIAREAQQAITLIKSFSLELNQYSPESQVLYWLNTYRAVWIRDAIIEAVYQGRYKIVSVQQILSIWLRRGQPVRHFTPGFEQVIAAQLGGPLHLATAPRHIEKANTPHPPAPQFTPEKSAAANFSSAPSVVSVGSHPGMSIKTFPVETFPVGTVDTLVDVYQSGSPRRGQTDQVAANPMKETNPRDARLMFYSDYVRPSASRPIQPFQPMPLRRR